MCNFTGKSKQTQALYNKHLQQDAIPPSVLPTPKTSRKLSLVRKPLIPDEKEVFDKNDEIKTFSELSDKLCPFGYKLDLHEEKATFYKTEYHAKYNIRNNRNNNCEPVFPCEIIFIFVTCSIAKVVS